MISTDVEAFCSPPFLGYRVINEVRAIVQEFG